jgi:hypothetical protein
MEHNRSAGLVRRTKTLCAANIAAVLVYLLAVSDFSRHGS